MFNRKINHTILLAGLFLASGCVFVLFSHKHEIAYTSVPLIVMVISALAAYRIWRDLPVIVKIPKGLKNLLFYVIFFCLYALMTTLQKEYIKYQLNKNGTIVNGIVIKDYSADVYRQGLVFYAEIEYRYNNVDYRQSVRGHYHIYKYHDSVKIVCSATDPEIFKIVGHEPGLNIKY